MGLRFAAIGALAGASALLIWGGEGIRLRAELSRPFLELLPASSGTWEEAQGATPDLKAAVADLGGQVGLAESATEPETEPATESAIEPAAEPAIEALAQPAAQPVAQADLPLPSQGVPNYLGALPLDDDEQGQRLENSVDLRADLVLGALAKETIIRAEPRPGARVLGYARTGSLLRRAAASAGNRGCKGGWYRVEPQGYVCVGNTATLDEEHPVLQIASLQPDRSMAMPYVYARSRYPAPPLYNKLPSQE